MKTLAAPDAQRYDLTGTPVEPVTPAAWLRGEFLPSEGLPAPLDSEPLTRPELKARYPELYRLLAAEAFKQSIEDYPEDLELERAHRRDQARGHDPALALDLHEEPKPWTRNGLKAPPYSKDVPERLRHTNELRIFMGKDAWCLAKEHHRTTPQAITLLPPGESPDLYDWGFVRGRVPLLMNCGAMPSDVDAIVVVLLAAGALRVVEVAPSGTLTTHFQEQQP